MRRSLRPEPLRSVWLMFAVRAGHAITQTDRRTCAPIYTLCEGFSIPSTMGKAEITSYTDCCPTPSVDMLGGAFKSSSSHGRAGRCTPAMVLSCLLPPTRSPAARRRSPTRGVPIPAHSKWARSAGTAFPEHLPGLSNGLFKTTRNFFA